MACKLSRMLDGALICHAVSQACLAPDKGNCASVWSSKSTSLHLSPASPPSCIHLKLKAPM